MRECIIFVGTKDAEVRLGCSLILVMYLYYYCTSVASASLVYPRVWLKVSILWWGTKDKAD